MATDRIAHTEWEINYHNEIVDDLNEYVGKAQALLSMALNSDLEKISSGNLYHYLWELDSLINTAKMLCEGME